LQQGLGFSTRGGDRVARGNAVQGEETLPEEGDDMWVLGVGEGERELVPVQGWGLLGCGLLLRPGRKRSRGLFLIFSFSFSFSFPFLVFCFYFYLLLKCFKSIQTSFIDFVKFLALF
jgi:hypothetical protein